jgi:hypothetical protein
MNNDGSTGTWWWRWAQSKHIITFDPANKSWTNLNTIPTSPVNDRIPFLWDLRGEGYLNMDDWRISASGSYSLYERHIPIWHHNAANHMMAYSQSRFIRDDSKVIVNMWMDATKATNHHEGIDGFEEYFETPEIMFMVSRDDGNSWSNIFRMNARDYPILGSIPGFIYPANKVLRLDDNTIRIYLMYTDHFTNWGTAAQQSDIPNAQNAIKFTAFDLDISNLTNTSDVVIPRSEVMLSQNFPNPFNPTTTIQFNLPTAGDVSLNVYNVRGQLVKNLSNGHYTSGNHTVVWNGTDNNNRSVASGIYFYRLEANNNVETKRMVLLK